MDSKHDRTLKIYDTFYEVMLFLKKRIFIDSTQNMKRGRAQPKVFLQEDRKANDEAMALTLRALNDKVYRDTLPVLPPRPDNYIHGTEEILTEGQQKFRYVDHVPEPSLLYKKVPLTCAQESQLSLPSLLTDEMET
jgi:hypothetical protein